MPLIAASIFACAIASLPVSAQVSTGEFSSLPDVPIAAYTLDLDPTLDNTPRALPVWLDPPVLSNEGALSTAVIPVMQAPGGAQLAVTIYFNDQPNGFLRVLWNGHQSQATISSNIFAGTDAMLSRTLLVPPESLTAAGALVLQSTAGSLPVRRLRFEWLGYAEFLAAATAPLPAVVRSEGQTASDLEVLGEPYYPGEDTWNGDVITAPLSDRIENLSEPTAFAFELQDQPAQSRLSAKIAVRDPSADVSIYVNGEYAGLLALPIPDLSDPGWFVAPDGSWEFAGWLSASRLIPASYLVAGENIIEFTWNEAAHPHAVALKDPAIQLRFGFEPDLGAPMLPDASLQQPASSNPPETSTPTATGEQLPVFDWEMPEFRLTPSSLFPEGPVQLGPVRQ